MGGRALYHHHGHAPGLLSAGQKAGEYRCWLSEQIDPWDPGPVSLSVHHSVPSHAQSLTDNKRLTFFFFFYVEREKTLRTGFPPGQSPAVGVREEHHHSSIWRKMLSVQPQLLERGSKLGHCLWRPLASLSLPSHWRL